MSESVKSCKHAFLIRNKLQSHPKFTAHAPLKQLLTISSFSTYRGKDEVKVGQTLNDCLKINFHVFVELIYNMLQCINSFKLFF